MPRHRFANLARSLVDRVVPRAEDHRLSAILACAEVCGHRRYCVEPPDGSARCAGAIRSATPAHACATDQDCHDPDYPWCVARVTDLQTGETTPAGGSALCASVSVRP